MRSLPLSILLLLAPGGCRAPAPAGPAGGALPPPRVTIVTGTGVDPAPMAVVEAGPFLRGSAKGPGEDDERPQRVIHLDRFSIDRFAVTVAQYRRCVEASACSMPDAEKLCTYTAAPPPSGPATAPATQPDPGRLPVNCVSWEQANAYCRWTGKRLPTEAEWEKAARGTDGRMFPWGNQEPTCALANFALGNERYCRSQTVPADEHQSSASPYGAVQMAGNVFNWASDWHDREYYAVSPDRNPQGPVVGKYRVVRGGSWFSPAVDLRVTLRGLIPPLVRLNYVGFRCAK